MFFGCRALLTLPDISKWETSNINDLSQLFQGCYSLKFLPDISKWNVGNVNNLSWMFCKLQIFIIITRYIRLGY